MRQCAKILLRQHRIIIVVRLRSQIYSAFAFCAARPVPLGRTPSDFVSAADCTNWAQAGWRSVFRRRRIMRSSEILCTHYALRAKRYGEKYASKMRKHDVCVVAPKVRQGRRTTEGNWRQSRKAFFVRCCLNTSILHFVYSNCLNFIGQDNELHI